MATATTKPILKRSTRKLEKRRPMHGVLAGPKARRRGLVVVNFNQRAVATCPGSTAWCRSHCYANRAFFLLKRDLYERDSATAHETNRIVDEVEELPAHAWVRIHASGDFDSAGYVEKWRLAALVRPDVRFWSYTRSWRDEAERRAPGLHAALERLRALPNVQLFASTDPETEAPPAGWRVAWIESDPRATGLACPEQTGAQADCLDCGFCVLGRRGDVVFHEH